MRKQEANVGPLQKLVLGNLRNVVIHPAEFESRDERDERAEKHDCESRQFAAGQRGIRFGGLGLGHSLPESASLAKPKTIRPKTWDANLR